SRRDAILRPARAGAGGRRRHYARSVFARGQQRRVLAGQRRYRGCGVLFVHIARAGGIPRASGSARAGVLRLDTRRIRADVRRRSERSLAKCRVARVLRFDLRGGRGSGRLGPRDTRAVKAPTRHLAVRAGSSTTVSPETGSLTPRVPPRSSSASRNVSSIAIICGRAATRLSKSSQPPMKQYERSPVLMIAPPR